MMTRRTATEPLLPTAVDPILAKAGLPLRATFFPLGFPVEVATNSHAVLAAARESWGRFQRRSAHTPLTICLGVASDADASSSLPPAPVCRARGHLMSHIADAYNFIHCDLHTGFSFGWITPQTAESPLYLRYHLLECAALCMIAALRATPLHAACVTVSGHGMLFCGDSGAGKSSLAFAGARSGWTFTSDDSSYLLLDCDRTIVGNCHQLRLRDSGTQLFPELEGRTVTPRATGKPSIEIPTAELPGFLTSESASIQSIVFLNRSNVRTPELVPYPWEKANAWFQQFPYDTASTRAAQQAALSHLLEVPIFELRYTGLDWAIDRLNTLALTGS
ncbi:phosphoenolpyruvate carboxykinase (ATP) [Edaphobacter bradus]|uniref:aldolase n=1 Tax=Edaphobacter bradus TaxID=2259016 RepID=UPI0021DF6C7C|nr:aldolase [Edaphobacter bradus]